VKENNFEENPGTPGSLFLVATPVGNLGDLTERAIQVLNRVDMIAAEDTRHTRKLLSYLSIHKRIISYYREKEKEQAEKILSLLEKGKNIALVSDAGTPGLSDPGAVIVQSAVKKGIRVVPIPGASACLLALVASGLPTDRFVFEGFLPRKKKEKRMRLECLAREERTMVVYEAPHRLIETLSDLKTYLGEDRRLVIAREMTKVYEEFWRGTLEEAVSEWEVRKSKGEFTLVLEGKSQELIVNQVKDYQPFYQEVIKRKGEGEKSSSIIREVAEREGLSRSGLYQYYLNKTKKGD
jgi:16S rRNA (cytidine1402-2'-O)-methyltransferase